MSWQMYRWIWKVNTPIHLGTSPAGALNRTRLYLPARTIWGALTAELARRRANSTFPDYEDTGRELLEKVRFTYLYPAERVNGRWYAWRPFFKTIEEYEGLCWYREDDEGPVPERKFRTWLLASIPGTSIDPASDTAQEGTLREMECIQTHWQKQQKSGVAFIGYVFFSDNSIKDTIFDIKELLIGADTRYGLGQISQVEQPSIETFCFGHEVQLDREHPLIKANTIFSHVIAYDIALKGSLELLQHWDRQNISISGLSWKPGSYIEEGSKYFLVLPNGLWKPKE